MAKKKTDAATAIDSIVGANLRRLRTLRGVSQAAMGASLGISFQQIQKYENATNRMSASTIVNAATFLNVTVSDFFEGSGQREPSEHANEASREVLELVRSYNRLNPMARDQIRRIVGVMAETAA